MLDDVGKTLGSVRKVVESPELEGAIAGVHRTADELPATVDETRAAIADLRRVLETAKGEARTTAAEARETIRAAREARERDHKPDGATLDFDPPRLGRRESADDPTLEEIDRSVKAIRDLVDYIQTHPEAVVLGKQKGEKG